MEGPKKQLTLDKISFQLGMINCFAEMVACGVKKLAISPPLSPQDYAIIAPISDKITREFMIKSHLEKSLLITDLQSEEFTKNKWSILYYQEDQILRSYKNLKETQKQFIQSERYDLQARKDISRKFMRLLSYPEYIIEKKLKKAEPDSPFILEET